MSHAFVATTPERARPLCANVVGDSERIDEVFVNSCLQVQQWRRDKFALQQSDARRALHDLQRDAAAIDSLRDALAVTEDLARGATDLQASSARVAQVVQNAAQAAASRREAAASLGQKLVREREGKVADLAAAEAKLERRRESAEAAHSDIESFFALFKEHAGLSIKRAAPSVVQVTLTLLDPLDPDRECSFKLGLADPVTYCVSDCSPALPSQLLSTLVARLNEAPMESCALPAFVCSIRRAFRRALTKTGAAGGA
eukprot:TRINITY_DN3346_c0_g1_i1.p1 TRINITY_DN3346_c0_g1~~TRINITY_DN3346_c0_g1_i1.p1  ORF type:complete len:258 (-),score=62.54 TRINITY_DN3346_c0_g1_i1:134-907(-)